jgi:hypothetical protein
LWIISICQRAQVQLRSPRFFSFFAVILHPSYSVVNSWENFLASPEEKFRPLGEKSGPKQIFTFLKAFGFKKKIDFFEK